MRKKTLIYFQEEFDKIDIEKKRKINYDQFKTLYGIIDGDYCSETDLQRLFRGLDVNHDKFISINDFLNLVDADFINDTLFQLKMNFRAFDSARKGYLNSKDLQSLSKFVSHKFPPAIEAQINAPNFRWSFSDLYQNVFHETIRSDSSDPYDGLITTHQQFSEEFDKVDTNKKFRLDFAQFAVFFNNIQSQIWVLKDANRNFYGLSVRDKKYVTKNDFIAFLKAMKEDDPLYKLKMVFRAYDTSRKKAIVQKHILHIEKFISHYWTSEEKQEIRQVVSWTFPQLYEKVFHKPCQSDSEKDAYLR